MEPIATALQAVVEAVADRALVMVDPNCRPTFVEDRDAYRARLAATLRHTHVVKVSGDDLEYLTPGASLGRGRSRAAGRWAFGRAGHARRRRCADRHRRPTRRRSPRRRSRSWTRSARATRSAAASSPTGRAPGSRVTHCDPEAVRAATQLRLRRRRPHLRAGGCLAAAALRPRRRPLSRATGSRSRGIRSDDERDRDADDDRARGDLEGEVVAAGQGLQRRSRRARQGSAMRSDASVPRIAIPSAPASCIETLMIPLREAGVLSGDVAHGDRQQRQHRRAHAEAHQREGTNSVGK